MSNKFTSACRPLRLSPPTKAVLMALADFAHDDGRDWHSIPSFMEWTCLGRTSVIEAMQRLEALGLVTVEKRLGRNNVIRLHIEQIEARAALDTAANPSATRTSPPTEPVREANQSARRTSPPDELHQSAARTPPVRVAYSTSSPGGPEASGSINEASGKQLFAPEGAVVPDAGCVDDGSSSFKRTSTSRTKEKPVRKLAVQPACPPGLSAAVWRDWLALRHAKKAPVTETVLESATREAKLAGLTLEAFLRIWCARGSQGLSAAWLKDTERPQLREARHAGFETKDYRAGVTEDGHLA